MPQDPFALGLDSFTHNGLKGGLVKLVKSFRKLENGGRNFLQLDDPQACDQQGVRLTAPEGPPWASSKRFRCPSQKDTLVSVMESWLSAEALIPKGEHLWYRWAFHRGNPGGSSVGAVHFALCEIHDAQTGQSLEPPIILDTTRNSSRFQWWESRWPRTPAAKDQRVKVTWSCCCGGRVNLNSPVNQPFADEHDAAHFWCWPQGLDWTTYPSALLIQSFAVGKSVAVLD